MNLADSLAWKDQALCRGMDINLFFPRPTKGSGRTGQQLTAKARSICARCPVAVECRDYAIEMTPIELDHGIFGGTSPRQRRQYRT